MDAPTTVALVFGVLGTAVSVILPILLRFMDSRALKQANFKHWESEVYKSTGLYRLSQMESKCRRRRFGHSFTHAFLAHLALSDNDGEYVQYADFETAEQTRKMLQGIYNGICRDLEREELPSFADSHELLTQYAINYLTQAEPLDAAKWYFMNKAKQGQPLVQLRKPYPKLGTSALQQITAGLYAWCVPHLYAADVQYFMKEKDNSNDNGHHKQAVGWQLKQILSQAEQMGMETTVNTQLGEDTTATTESDVDTAAAIWDSLEGLKDFWERKKAGTDAPQHVPVTAKNLMNLIKKVLLPNMERCHFMSVVNTAIREWSKINSWVGAPMVLHVLRERQDARLERLQELMKHALFCPIPAEPSPSVHTQDAAACIVKATAPVPTEGAHMTVTVNDDDGKALKPSQDQA